MSNSFRALSSHAIDYYDLGKERLAALAYLANGTAPRDTYVKLDLPFPIGVLRPEIVQNLPLAPINGGGHFLARMPLKPYSAANPKTMEGIIDGLAKDIRLQPSVTQVQVKALGDVHRAILNYDRQLIGGDKVRVGTDTDNRNFSPDLLKAPMWHFDFETDQRRPEKGFMLPEVLQPIVRGYAVRVAPPGCEENVQLEYVKDRMLTVNGGLPHPLILKTWEISKRAVAFREGLGIKTPQIREFLQKDLKFAAGWAEFLEEQAAVTAKMRQEGLVHQGAPNEILIATNYTYHITRKPSRQIDSLFAGLQVRPEGQSL